MQNRLYFALALSAAFSSQAVAAPPTPGPAPTPTPYIPKGTALEYCHIAREYSGTPGLFDADIPPALGEDHKVAFVASLQTDNTVKRVHIGDGTYLDTIDLPAAGFTDPTHVKINAGVLGIAATRHARGLTTYRGAYSTSLASSPNVAFQTLHETVVSSMPPEPFIPSNKTAPILLVSSTGQIAFSTIHNGQGSLYRGPALGPVSVLHAGSGTFFNVWDIDFNTADTVTASMEYNDPTSGTGLTYGVVNFDDPTQSGLHDMETPLEHVGLGNNTHARSNNLGQVAFFINTAITGKFFTPYDVWSPNPTTTITLQPGVYVAQSKPWGQPWAVTMIADTTGAYASFSKVDINDQGLVVFQAALDAGGYGIYFGPDAAHQFIARYGDTFQGRRFVEIKMGELNNSGELSLLTVDFQTVDRELWRVGIKPGSPIWPTTRGLVAACTQ